MENQEKNQSKGLRFFFPNARCLSDKEIAELPSEKREVAEASGKNGIWMEVFCPDDSCLNKDGNIVIPVRSEISKEKRGIWVNLFCPEDQCLIQEGTDLV
jgi:hypothetical protein